MILHKVVTINRESVFATGKYNTIYEKGSIVSFPKTLGAFCFYTREQAEMFKHEQFVRSCSHIIIDVECDEKNIDTVCYVPFLTLCLELILDSFYGLLEDDIPASEVCMDSFVNVPTGTCLARELKVLT